MSINEFVEMTIFLCLICFSIYDKMQGFVDLFIYLGFYVAFNTVVFLFDTFNYDLQELCVVGWTNGGPLVAISQALLYSICFDRS